MTDRAPVNVLAMIGAERRRQKLKEGWTTEHDDREHSQGELADAAACYVQVAAAQARGASAEEFTIDAAHEMGWPWHEEWWKPKDQLRNLVRAGALIVAEIERLNRLEAPRD